MWPDGVFLRAKKWRDHDGGPFFVEQKLDGFHVCVTREDTATHVWSAREGVYGDRRDFAIPIPWNLPAWTCVECELIWPGHPAAEVPTAIKQFPDKLLLWPFAVPFYKGVDKRDVSYCDMRAVIRSCCAWDSSYEVYKTINPSLLLELARSKGYEGWVIKEYGYRGWWKLKVEDTLDLRVIGFKPGTGKYSGKVGALILADTIGEVALCSGMTDEERFALTDADIGRICEVKHNGVTKYRRLRHPRFLRWRDDKGEPNEVKGDEASE